MNRKTSRALRLWVDSSRNAVAAINHLVQLQEVAAASAITISLRMLSWYETNPLLASSDSENRRMWQEKQDAFNLSSNATVHWQEAWATQFARQWQSVLAPTRVSQDRWATDTNRWVEIWLTGANAMLKPYHTRSTGNARRLSQKRLPRL